jgi:hypothetical protein
MWKVIVRFKDGGEKVFEGVYSTHYTPKETFVQIDWKELMFSDETATQKYWTTVRSLSFSTDTIFSIEEELKENEIMTEKETPHKWLE